MRDAEKQLLSDGFFYFSVWFNLTSPCDMNGYEIAKCLLPNMIIFYRNLLGLDWVSPVHQLVYSGINKVEDQ